MHSAISRRLSLLTTLMPISTAPFYALHCSATMLNFGRVVHWALDRHVNVHWFAVFAYPEKDDVFAKLENPRYKFSKLCQLGGK